MFHRMGFLMVFVVACALALGACSSPEPAQPAPAKPAPAPATPTQPGPSTQGATAAAPAAMNSWNFSKLAVEQWQWIFPGGAKNKTFQGAWYEGAQAGAGPRWAGGSLDAAKYGKLRVLMMVTSPKADGKGRDPVDLVAAPMLYWATPKDVQAGDAWMTGRNRVRAGRPDEKNPYLWEFQLAGHPRWKDPIGGLTFTVPTKEGAQQLRVVIKEITFVE